MLVLTHVCSMFFSMNRVAFMSCGSASPVVGSRDAAAASDESHARCRARMWALLRASLGSP